jgi:hypothetical protein
LKLKETPWRDVPENLTTCAFNATCSIYLEFCNERIQFKKGYLQYLKLANNEEIIKPFFGISLPAIFGLPFKYKLPFEINYQYNRPNLQNNTEEFSEIGLDYDQNEVEEWLRLLILIKHSDSSTEAFKNKFEEFYERIKSSEIDNDEIF